MKRRALILCLAACLFLAASFPGASASGETPDEEVFFTFAPSVTPVPREESALIPETRVSSHLVVLAYHETDDGTWASPDLPALGPAVPRLYQNDHQSAVCEYDGEARSVATSGCGAACLSMALYYFFLDSAQTPTTLLREACLNGWYQGNGLSQKNLESLAKAHGLNVRRAGKSIAAIKNALLSGCVIIASMGEGYFGKGHYILLRGITQENELYINDPNSEDKSEHAYPLLSLYHQLAGAVPLIILSPSGAESAQTPAP